MPKIRPQYHIREEGCDLLAWDVTKLIQQSQNLPVKDVHLHQLAELDHNHWFQHDTPTPRRIAQHAQLIAEADLGFAIILDSNGRVMDGMHRICKAMLEGLETVRAVQFTVDPEPDFRNVAPQDLPYE